MDAEVISNYDIFDNMMNTSFISNLIGHVNSLDCVGAEVCYISRRPMPRSISECQVSKMANSDTCPRSTTGPRQPQLPDGARRGRKHDDDVRAQVWDR